ncbi:Xaa-Pro dipeptidyl-peptidase [Actinomadura sp. HBU206391]|uniref:Xaa-Pro dipeptidyl-peptidase n=1 Tax=Actinomadura sp. HBU206391 TaxID=2731692 RepID=UPI0021C83D6E|nr:Xaa-Pro dipeptidyl-peptidase [Actinomadura sp. HBU206391]
MPGIRRPRKRALALIVPLLLGGSLATGGVASAQAKPKIKVANGVTQPVFSYADAIREYVYVESTIDSDADGRKDRVRVDIIRPKESGRGLKVPVIIDESPYYDNSGRGNEAERKVYDASGGPAKFPLFYDNYFVPRGYAVLNVDMIGTTKSEGCNDTGGRADVLGGKAVIDWLNGRARAYGADGKAVKATWTTGKAAMIGKSYDGTLANGVAATGVKGLETIVPISAISSWYRYQRMNGVTYDDDNYQTWLAQYVDTEEDAKCAATHERMNAEDGDETGNFNPYWAERDYLGGTLADVDKVRASVFAVHTVNDLNVKPDHFSTWWKALAQRGVPRKVWVGQYHHVDPFDFRRDEWVSTLHRWFDQWLYRIPNGIMKEPRADVQTGPDTWITQSDWPAREGRSVSLRPQAGGGLDLRAGAGTASFTDARLSEDVLAADPTVANPNRLAFVSSPLPTDVRLSGTPAADLRVKLDKPTANLTALVVDYGEDTRVDWRTGAGITTLTEESCHGESTAADDACYKKTRTNTANRPLEIVARGWIDAQNRRSLSHPTPLQPGKYAQVRWQTLPQEYVFKKGHRLALIIAGTDSTYTADAATGAAVTVDLAASKITVPVVVGGGTFEFGAQTKSKWQGPGRIDLPTPPNRLW